METRDPVTDSPWLWLGLFLGGAVVALVLMAPRYAQRQAQLERQFTARENAGQTLGLTAPRPATAPEADPRISLRPLFILFLSLLLLASALFWMVRYRADPTVNGPPPAVAQGRSPPADSPSPQ